MKTTTEIVNVNTQDGWSLAGLYFAGYDLNSDIGAILMHGWVTHYDAKNKETFLFGKQLETAGQVFSQNGIPSLVVANRGYYRPEFFNDCVLDIQACIDFLLSKGVKRVILVGHSLGGAKSTYFAGTQNNQNLKALVLMSAIPAIHGLFAREDLLVLMKEKIEKGEGDLIFSKKEGQAISTFLPTTFMRNYESSYQKETLDAAEGITVPVLSVAAEKEWDWFREVLNNIKDRATKSPKVDTKIFDGVTEHTYVGHEKEVAEYVVSWVKRLPF